MHLSLRTKILIGFGISWLAIVCTGVIGYYAILNLTSYASQAHYAQTLHDAIDNLLTQLINAESGQRGFLITGNKDFLRTYNTALPQIATNLEELHTLLDNHNEQIPPDQLEALDLAIARQFEILTQGIEIRRTQGMEIEQIENEISNGNENMENIRNLLVVLEQQESAEFFQQEALVQTKIHWAGIIIIIGSFLALVLTVIGGVGISSRINTSTKALILGVNHVAEGNLEYRVPISSHDEIATLTKAFNEMADRLQIAQNDLGKSMALFQSLFEASPDAILVINTQDLIIHANPRAETLFGYSQSELLGQPLTKLFPENYDEWDGHPLQAFHTDLKPVPFGTNPDLTIVTRKGTEIPVDIQLGLVSRDGAPLILCTIRDISLEKRNRDILQKANQELEKRVQIRTAELERSERAYRLMAENALVGVYQSTVDGKVLYANPAIAKIFGAASVEEILLHSTQIRYKDPQRRVRLIEKLNETKQVQDIELEMLTVQGENITLLANMTLDGNILSGMLLDITKRKKAEDALQQSESRLHIALTASAMGVWEWNLQTDQVYWSPECFLITGMEEMDQNFERFRRMLHSEDLSVFEKTLQKSISTGDVFALEFRIQSPNFETRWLSIFGIIQYDHTDRPSGMIGTLQDISIRKNTEAQLQGYTSRVAILAEASRIFTEASLNYQEVTTKIIQYISETFGDFCILRQYSVDPNLDDQVIFYDPDLKFHEAFQTIMASISDKESLSVWGIRAKEIGTPLVITAEEIKQQEIPHPYLPLQEQFGFTGMIIVPLKYRRQIMGLLYLIRHQPTKMYTNEDVTLAQELTGRAALAISNAQLFELVQKELAEKALAEEEIRKLNIYLEERIVERTQELQNSLAKTEALYTIARATVAIDKLDEALKQIVEGVAVGLPAHRVVLLNFDFTAKKVLHLVRGGPGADEHTPDLTYEDWMEGLTGWVIREGKAILSPKGQADMREAEAAQQRRKRTHAGCIAVVPLRFADQVIGTLTAIHHIDGGDYTDADVALLQAMANQAAAMLVHANVLESLRQSNIELQNEIAERTQLEVQIRQGAERAKALADMSKILAEARLEEQPLYHLIVRQVTELIGDTCNISIITNDGKYLKLLAFYHPDPECAAIWETLSTAAPYRIGEGLAGRVAQTGEPILISNISSTQLTQQMNKAFVSYLEKFELASICIVPVHARDRVVGVLGVARDKTGKPYTYEDQVFLQDLADRAGLAIENSRLFIEANIAREEADEANQAKSEFLSRMSHELRTPLHAILGFAQILGMDVLSKSQKTAVQHILQGGKHLLTLINEILDITRIESGQLLLNIESVALPKLLQEVIEMVQDQATSQEINLNFNCKTNLYAKADRQRLKQVLLNILLNAIKYNRERGQVWISCDALSETEVQIRIRDSGQGISLEQQKHLFIPFERLGAERTTIEGMGLGLALSQQLTHAMNGELGVESELGVGSTFWITLPQTENPVEQSYHPDNGLIQIPAASGLPPQHTILYIEDNFSNLQLVEEILKLRPTIRLLAGLDGETGLEIAAQNKPDLILLDLHLPDMRGDEVATRLKSNPQTQQIPIIIVSADATQLNNQALLKAGIQAYLTKPIDVANFLQVLDTTLEEIPSQSKEESDKIRPSGILEE